MLSVTLSNRSAMISQATTTCCLRIAGRFLDLNGVVGSSPVILSLLVGSSRLLSTTTQAFLRHITFGLLVSLVRFTLIIATPHSFASPVIPPFARSAGSGTVKTYLRSYGLLPGVLYSHPPGIFYKSGQVNADPIPVRALPGFSVRFSAAGILP